MKTTTLFVCLSALLCLASASTFFTLTPEQFENNEQIQASFDYGAQYITTLAINAGRIPRGEYEVTDVLSVEQRNLTRGNNYRFGVYINSTHGVNIYSLYTVYYNFSSSAVKVVAYKYNYTYPTGTEAQPYQWTTTDLDSFFTEDGEGETEFTEEELIIVVEEEEVVVVVPPTEETEEVVIVEETPEVVEEATEEVVEVVEEATEEVVEVVEEATEEVVEVVEEATEEVVEVVEEATEEVVEAVEEAVESVEEAVEEAVESVEEAVEEAVEVIVEAGEEAVEEVIVETGETVVVNLPPINNSTNSSTL